MKSYCIIRQFKTHRLNLAQMTRAARRSTSEPSSISASQTRYRQVFGKQLANSVRNHCIENTLITGGSYSLAEAHVHVNSNEFFCQFVKHELQKHLMKFAVDQNVWLWQATADKGVLVIQPCQQTKHAAICQNIHVAKHARSKISWPKINSIASNWRSSCDRYTKTLMPYLCAKKSA